MNIIIVGCGKVGASLAERLSAEDHNLVLVDLNQQKVEELSNRFDAMGVVGNGASFNIQQEAGVETADLFIAVTGADELNLLCCLMAKKSGHCQTIARVRNPMYNQEIRFIKEQLGISMIINPELTAAYVQNVDLRYEWYPTSGETVSVSLFYKHFRNPIETAILDAGGSYTYTFENADRANVYGVEFDIRKDLAFLGLKNFSLSFNASLIESEVNFSEESLEHDRPMQGQSPYLINGGLFYQPERLRLTVGVLYNRIGKRIVGIGRTDLSTGGSVDNDIPDMYEMPRNALDLVVSKRLGRIWEIKLSARDLLNEEVRFCQFPEFTDEAGRTQQREQTTKRFRPGRSFSLGVTARF